MIPSDVKETLIHALGFKLDFENKRTDEKANPLMSKAMAKRYAENKRQTEQALTWLGAQPTEEEKMSEYENYFKLKNGDDGLFLEFQLPKNYFYKDVIKAVSQELENRQLIAVDGIKFGYDPMFDDIRGCINVVEQKQ